MMDKNKITVVYGYAVVRPSLMAKLVVHKPSFWSEVLANFIGLLPEVIVLTILIAMVVLNPALILTVTVSFSLSFLFTYILTSR